MRLATLSSLRRSLHLLLLREFVCSICGAALLKKLRLLGVAGSNSAC